MHALLLLSFDSLRTPQLLCALAVIHFPVAEQPVHETWYTTSDISFVGIQSFGLTS